MSKKENRTIYHGSDHIVTQPFYGGGRQGNDYGSGFYCTEVCDLAREWACLSPRGGFLNVYSINESGLSVLDLTSPEFTALHWLALLLNNREIRLSSSIEEDGMKFLVSNYLPEVSGADVIKGYRADDSFFSFARAFLRNTLSYSQLEQVLHYGDLGIQYVITGRKAFDQLQFVTSEPVNGRIFYAFRKNRDLQAREKYRELVRGLEPNGLYLSGIMQEGITNECL